MRENGPSNNRHSNKRQAQANNNSNKSQLQANINKKWVIILSSTSLTEGQQSVLAKGLNLSLTPNYIPNIEYITVVESRCGKLKEQETMERRTDINALLRKAKVTKPNITRQESIALSQLRRVILTADKGVAMVVMDREDHINKAKDLLLQLAYGAIPADPTNRIKAQLITKLRRIKKETNMDEDMYKAMYPTGFVPQKFYGLPKIHKTGNLLRPIVSSRASVTYGVAKTISRVLKPLVGKSLHHIQSMGDFVSKAKGLTIQQGECLTSYDVTSLFTLVPIDPALNIIKDLLEKDEKLNDRTVLSVQNILKLLGFCLHNTYFSFQNKFYEQVEDAAMGSPVSPLVANLYMEYFEGKALATAINPPRYGTGLWRMTLGSFNNRLINRHSWITSTVLIQQSGLQSKVPKKMGLSHFLIPWSNP